VDVGIDLVVVVVVVVAEVADLLSKK